MYNIIYFVQLEYTISLILYKIQIYILKTMCYVMSTTKWRYMWQYFNIHTITHIQILNKWGLLRLTVVHYSCKGPRPQNNYTFGVEMGDIGVFMWWKNGWALFMRPTLTSLLTVILGPLITSWMSLPCPNPLTNSWISYPSIITTL